MRIDIPVRSRVSRVSLCTKASAKVIKLASSERSLFFDMSRFKIPQLFPRAFANSSNPTSVKAFLLMSRCCKVLFLSKNLEKAVIPSLLMIFPPTENSYMTVLTDSSSTRSSIASSFILFPLKLRYFMLLLSFKAELKCFRPTSVI